MEHYLPVLLMLAIALGMGLVMAFLGDLIGVKAPNQVKGEAYECGVAPYGNARIQVPVKFYLVCLLFLLFDVEAAFILLWAIYFSTHTTLFGFAAMGIFMGILVVGLIYEWKKGALQWQK